MTMPGSARKFSNHLNRLVEFDYFRPFASCIAVLAFLLLPFSSSAAWSIEVIADNQDRSVSICLPRELARIAFNLYPDESANFAFSPLPSEEMDVFEFEDFVYSFNFKDEPFSDEDKAFLVSEYSYHAELARQGVKSSFELPEEMREAAEEFMLYLDGCADLRENSGSASIPKAWNELLLLPKEKRIRRSSWVLYMLGNLDSFLGRSESAHLKYDELRKLVSDGFHDSAGLAYNSFKRDYMCEKDLCKKLKFGLRAIRFYLCIPDRQSVDIIRFIVRDFNYILDGVIFGEKDMSALAGDPVCAQILLAKLLDSSTYTYEPPIATLKRIFPAFEKTLPDKPELLCYSAYFMNDSALCRKWASSCAENSLIRIWVLAELARKDKDWDLASKLYRKWIAVRKSPSLLLSPEAPAEIRFSIGYEHLDPYDFSSSGIGILSRARENLALCSIHRREFIEALHNLMLAGSFTDVNYMAESVLSRDELIKYVSAFEKTPEIFPEEKRKIYSYWIRYDSQDMTQDMTGNDHVFNFLKYILGRRLMRDGCNSEARKFLPKDSLRHLDSLEKFKAISQDSRFDADSRALALYNAAKIMRWYGMSLQGTGGWPDNFDCYGNYDVEPRLPHSEMPPDLIAREQANAPKIPLRFHYRYIAADMMNEASDLAHDIQLKALALYIGGRYIDNRNPQMADPLYKKLVRLRCGDLSDQADRRRWFPRKYSRELEDELKNSNPLASMENVKDVFAKRTPVTE